MPGEHLETIREGYASFNVGGTSWTRDQVTEDVEWGTTGAFPGMERVYRGPEGVEEWVQTLRGEWEEFEVSIEEVLRETSEALAVTERIWGRGRGSGAEGTMSVHTVYRFTPDGRIRRRQSFTTREEALAALDRPSPQE